MARCATALLTEMIQMNNDRRLPPHPIQPLVMVNGVKRFRCNEVVAYLLEHGGLDMNHLAAQQFKTEDYQQFCQLIGYSLSGYGELSWVDDAAYEAAVMVSEADVSSTEARLAHVQQELDALKLALREPMARLYGKHPDDLIEIP